MIVYLDSSVLARCYLPDESGHEQARQLLEDLDVGLITGTWTRIEVSGALVRAAKASRGDESGLLAALDADLAADGPVTLVGCEHELVEELALTLVRSHALRAMDAWHLATARLVSVDLVEPDEPVGFASRDAAQLAAASAMGFVAA